MAIRYTQAERTGYVDAFKASGLSQTVFCKTQNISFKSFNNWVRLDSPGRLKKCSVQAIHGHIILNQPPPKSIINAFRSVWCNRRI
jgi:hypothetical protein